MDINPGDGESITGLKRFSLELLILLLPAKGFVYEMAINALLLMESLLSEIVFVILAAQSRPES